MTEQARAPDTTRDDRGSGPSDARRQDHGKVGVAGRVWGAVVLAVGLWLFATITLHLDLPDVPVRDLWPLAIILIGAVMLFGSRRRGG